MPENESSAVTLQVTPTAEPSFTSAEILPGRGMMTLQVRARLPKLGEVDLIASPPLAEAEARFERGARQPLPGNESYFFGEAVLIPYAPASGPGSLRWPDDRRSPLGFARSRRDGDNHQSYRRGDR